MKQEGGKLLLCSTSSKDYGQVCGLCFWLILTLVVIIVSLSLLTSKNIIIKQEDLKTMTSYWIYSTAILRHKPGIAKSDSIHETFWFWIVDGRFSERCWFRLREILDLRFKIYLWLLISFDSTIIDSNANPFEWGDH